MEKSLHVLVVEDSEDDTLLLMEQLREGGYAPVHQRVETSEAMREALRERHWDAVIADFAMPRFSGPHALEVLKESGLDIPFIMVSGTMPGEIGVEMMLAGAQDFVLKDDLARLVPAVAREMREARVRQERRRVAEALKRSEERFRLIFRSSPTAMMTYSRDRVVTDVNPAFERLYGYSRGQVVGRGIDETSGRQQNRQMSLDIVERVFAGEVVENVEWEDVRADGAEVCVLATIAPIYGDRGEVVMALASITDITERRQAEERERDLVAHKTEFYRRTILAATDGKLMITEADKIRELAGEPVGTWQVRTPEDIGRVRDDVAVMARDAGMGERRVPDLMLCVMESLTNAYKHAGGGTASLHQAADSLVFVVSDEGPGIEGLALPDVALRKGYSTASTLGMGYKLMIALADRVYLATEPGGTTVAVEVRLLEEPFPTPSDTLAL